MKFQRKINKIGDEKMLFSNENIIDFLENEKYNLSGYICILQYVELTGNSNYWIMKLLCEYAEEILDLVKYIERCFPNFTIIERQDKEYLEKIKNYKPLFDVEKIISELENDLKETFK